MDQAIKQVIGLLEQGITAILNFLVLVWTWSFGQIVAVFQSDWQSLPIWKMVVLAAVMLAIAYVLYKAAIELWAALQSIIKAFVALLMAFVAVLPYIVVGGLIAFAGGYVINNVAI